MGSVRQCDTVDVVVVGAGIIGLAAAWELQRRGVSVAVVDPAPGSGASRAAAGMIAPASEAWYQQSAIFSLMTASAARYAQFVRGVEDAADQVVGYRTTETLVCAAHPADRQTLADLHQYQLQHGLAVEQLTQRAARALEPALSPRLAGAFQAVGDHQVDPRRLVAGLLTALRRGRRAAGDTGATVIRDRAVRLLRGADRGVTGVLLAGGRTLHAAETILATGVDLHQLTDVPEIARLPLRPVHGDILRTRTPVGAPRLIERTIRGLVNGVPVYLVPRADSEIVIGATEREDGLDGPSAGGVFRLLRDAQALVPGVADLELMEVTARARPGTPDDVPFLGRVHGPGGAPVPGLVVSTGYFRHGVLLAPLAARLAADLVTGEVTGEDAAHLAAVDPRRFTAAALDLPTARHQPTATSEVSR